MFVLLLAIPLAGVELDLRALNEYQWFNGHANKFRNQNADVIFLGSSLMSAAVREEKFAELISVKDKPPRRAINLEKATLHRWNICMDCAAGRKSIRMCSRARRW